MNIIQNITLTEEESQILHNVIGELAEIKCGYARCLYCPLNVHSVDSHSCLINLISDILKKYGYKDNKDDQRD